MLERTRPRRGEIDEAAIALLARHGAQILATARRYAASREDAEDAYQRALEILLTKAPTTREDELVPWLKTVVKHEAFALRRQRDRLTPVTGDGEPLERGTAAAATHEQAERYERLRQGAEALRRLKPQEIRCLVLRAQGLSYREICEVTGFTYTKVNRCLTEGRQALTVRLAGIEGGIECTRLAPLLSALADGEADADALALLRPHLKSCLACRARLREFRAAPGRVAALAPAALGGGGEGGLQSALAGLQEKAEALHATVQAKAEALHAAAQQKAEALHAAAQQKAEALLAATQHKAAALGERAHTAAELVAGQKVAALAASAAALAGGGTAVDHLANHRGPPHPPPTIQQTQAPPVESTPVESTPEALLSPPPAAPDQEATAEPAVPPPPEPPPEAPPPPDPASEFGLSAAPAAQPEVAPAAAATPAGPSPGGRSAPQPSAPNGAREFAP
jgi:RNA polymerase sigma factor (sigma-70 family)